MLRTLSHLVRPTLAMLLLFTLLTAAYTALVTGVAQLAFPFAANGSLWLDAKGARIGSARIGQQTDDPKYLWGRPSALSPAYDASQSGASDLPAGDPALLARVTRRIDALRQADPANMQPVPVDLVTASASGLDPEISPAAADFQLRRIARLRNLPEENIRDVIHGCAKDRWFGLFGEPLVNVLCVNLTLDGTLPPQARR